MSRLVLPVLLPRLSPRFWTLVAVSLLLLALAGCDSPEERLQSHMQRGIGFFEAGDYEKARVELKNALQIKPTHGEAYYYLGRIYDEQQLWPEAMRAYNQAVDQAPEHLDANIRLGRYFVLANDLPRAFARAEHVITLTEGKYAEGYALRGSVYLVEEQLDEAEADARRALELEPANATATGVLAGIHRKKGEIDAAIAVLADGIAQHPENAALRLTKISLHLEQDDRAAAERDLLGLLAIDPDNIRYRIGLARFYINWDRLDDAEQVLRDGVKRQPDDRAAKLALADFLYNKRGFAAAEEGLRVFIAETPDDSVLRFALAELYRRGEQPQAAMDVLREIMELREGKQEARDAKAALADLLYREGNVEDAKRAVAEILSVDPRNFAALQLSGRIELGEGRVQEAIESLRTVLREKPDSEETLSLLTQAYVAYGQPGLAIDTLRRLVEVNPANNAARIQLSQYLAKDGRFEAALKLLDGVLERAPQDLPALATEADILVLLGRYREAETIARHIEELPSGETLALKLQGRIAAAGGQHQEAVSMFQRARAANPEDWQPVNGIVTSLAELGDLGQAASVLREIVEQKPDHQHAWVRLGDVLALKGETLPAAEAYTRAIEIDPKDLDAHSRLVSLYSKRGDEKAMIAALRRAADANETNATVRVSLALALERAGEFGEAIDVYEALIEEGYRNVFTVNNLSALIADHAYEDAARVEQAIAMMQPFQTSDNALINDTIGWLHFRAGNTAQALSFLKRAVSLDGEHPELRRHLGEAYQRAGDQEMAKRYLSNPEPSRETAGKQEGESK